MNKYIYIMMVLMIFLSIPFGIAHIDGPTIEEIGSQPFKKTYIKIIKISDPDGVERVEVLEGSVNLKFSRDSVVKPKNTYYWTSGGKSDRADDQVELDGYWKRFSNKDAAKEMIIHIEYKDPKNGAELTLRAMSSDGFWSKDKYIKNEPDEKKGGCVTCHSIGGVQIPTDKPSLLYRTMTNFLKFEWIKFRN